ncbi:MULTISPECIES: nitrogenase-stabilizing/protective protein NifW [Frankia]|uniref:Nitrogenase-stabilizing/protective protein NifW n=2 Tax=Frankia alni (strain DSM 45986 / CECT 9034 / ACN14a) TaxID=326424 RepID=NIFW_FRAAA|nr:MULTISPECIES: nitrogenase-stabilizing/protective protein NifW [Frankia]Q0RAW2.1 RecName: Full=Nitrogenase-stabilizing/protective protein NifW [Frankia alni ACN14a]AAU00808.1 NifW [Frankia alni ACN14a]CAJ65428.1 Nitrogenase stabilizing/protective protein nifW [Frankia alni ACN14a]
MSATTDAGQLAAFHRCSTAEEYFTLLEVDYDPRVVAVNRLHILKHFAGELAKLPEAGADAANPRHLLHDYRDALVRSYEAFTNATALDHRLFKVLKDRAPKSAFVPASEITVERLGSTQPSETSEQTEEAR